MKYALIIFIWLFFFHFFAGKSFAQLAWSDSCHKYSADRRLVINDILLEGNHITKKHIIFRELVFKVADTLTESKLCELIQQSRRNLLNRSIFNFVDMELVPVSASHDLVNVKIRLVERWYVWPMPILELADRNINAWWETKDFRKVNAGIFITVNNFRGRLEQLKVLLRAGYNQSYYLQYDIPYLTKAQNFGMGIRLGYMLSREMPYVTIGNKQLFYRATDGYARKEKYAQLRFYLRKGIHNSHDISLGYEQGTYADTVMKLNPAFMNQADGLFRMFHLSYNFKHDYRDSKPYPLTGHYADVELHQNGLGLLKNEGAFSTAKLTVDVYNRIATRWFWAANFTGKIASQSQTPYFLNKSLGFGNDYVRSFELFVVDGKDFALFKSNLKFALLQPRRTNIGFIKSEKFGKLHYAAYLNLLFDAGYVNQPIGQPSNNFQNTWLLGTGIGMDVVTYYDIVWRFEYSYNKYQKGGFFLHFVAPI